MTLELKDLVPGKRYLGRQGRTFVFIGHGRIDGAADYDGSGCYGLTDDCGPFTPIIKKKQIEGWVNLYSGPRSGTTIYQSREMAITRAGFDRIDTVKIIYEEPIE